MSVTLYFFVEDADKESCVSHHSNHGWDSSEPDMAAVFVARGPSFRHRTHLERPGLAGTHNMEEFDNLQIANLVSNIIGVPDDVRPPNNVSFDLPVHP